LIIFEIKNEKIK